MSHIDVLNQFPFTFPVQPPAQNDTFLSPRCFFLESVKLHRKGVWKSECICGPEVTSVKDLRMVTEWNMGSFLCPCTEPENPLPIPLTSWEDYYKWRLLPFESPVAVLLHWPLTLYHCLQLSCIQTSGYDGQGSLCIHYLGPEKELLQLSVFGELCALFPGVRIYIELVGPAVPKSRDGEVINVSSYAHCSDESCCCKSSIGSKDLSCSAVTFRLRKGLYHKRYNDIVKDAKPHLILAPNAGIAAYPTWMPTIEMIKETGIPAIFTDFCEEAAHLAISCITSITGRSLRVPIQLNPFRQPIAMDNNALCLPCYSNCFVFGM
ncbi:hypothetical protein GUJ93_ZPchr0007g5163 [Zizania palustris]|uniref:Mitochondrial splicing suppressor 51-like C-terminal domain-containing protein n=1 Tax=Zizania palustris TaxID=103762 RepID=A0A8J5T9L0_ZIZPA|nr:hypothetical protein GUJ93_ZPchr0007g5163 [Zizania palustris]